MGYVEQSLGAHEGLVYRAHFHWLHKSAGWLVLTVFVVGSVAALLNDQNYLSLILLCFGLIAFFLIMYPIWSQQVVVTDQRLIHRRGLIARSTEELQLESVEEVRVEQGILGRMLDYGKVFVTGTGEQSLKLPTLADPIGLRQKLQEATNGDAPVSAH